jgi:DNA-binding ferritin-like protein
VTSTKEEEEKRKKRMLAKYKDVRPVDLMDEIYERLKVLLLKLSTIELTEAEWRALNDVFEEFVNDFSKIFNELKQMVEKKSDYVP